MIWMMEDEGRREMENVFMGRVVGVNDMRVMLKGVYKGRIMVIFIDYFGFLLISIRFIMFLVLG